MVATFFPVSNFLALATEATLLVRLFLLTGREMSGGGMYVHLYAKKTVAIKTIFSLISSWKLYNTACNHGIFRTFLYTYTRTKESLICYAQSCMVTDAGRPYISALVTWLDACTGTSKCTELRDKLNFWCLVGIPI